MMTHKDQDVRKVDRGGLGQPDPRFFYLSLSKCL